MFKVAAGVFDAAVVWDGESSPNTVPAPLTLDASFTISVFFSFAPAYRLQQVALS
jgi:hypothetical protein